MAYEELFAGLIQLHILYHAAEEEIYGLGMLEELRRHGYRVGPSTLYPLLHRLTQRGYLKARQVRMHRTRRLMYRATPKGRRALAAVSGKVRELNLELKEESRGASPTDRSDFSPGARR